MTFAFLCLFAACSSLYLFLVNWNDIYLIVVLFAAGCGVTYLLVSCSHHHYFMRFWWNLFSSFIQGWSTNIQLSLLHQSLWMFDFLSYLLFQSSEQERSDNSFWGVNFHQICILLVNLQRLIYHISVDSTF